MSAGGATAPDEPRWLDEEEMAAWLPLIRLVYLLPQRLDRRLRAEAGVSHAYYQVLAVLSGAPEGRLPMGELARLTVTSPSRLSHAVGSLEQRGWVERRPCPDDRRVQHAALTDAGRAELRRVAPTHVAQVRAEVFDRLTAEQVAQLRAIGEHLVAGLDAADGTAGSDRTDPTDPTDA